MHDQRQPMTAESVKEIFEEAGASVMIRSGRTESYSAPRDFSFEVKGVFSNGMELHVVARQFTYRDPWETLGRVNDAVDLSLIRNGVYSSLPKGYQWFQRQDTEEGVDDSELRKIVAAVGRLNTKVYLLQALTGDSL